MVDARAVGSFRTDGVFRGLARMGRVGFLYTPGRAADVEGVEVDCWGGCGGMVTF